MAATNHTMSGGADVTPLRLAEQILQRREWASRCLLVQGNRGEFVSLYTQDPQTGIWRDPEATVLGWLGTISDRLESYAYDQGKKKLIDPKLVYGMVRGARGIKTPDKIRAVCRSFAAADDRLQEGGYESHLWRCRPIELNANLRFLGVQNGVVDLYTAKLASFEEAAAAFITVSAPVPYDPDLFPSADWFLSHLAEHERNWWLDIIGFSLRGIAKKLYACLAAPDSGKTTAINLLRGALGPYVDSPTPGALDARQRYDASGHTPGLAAWAAPVRITILDELKERELHANVVKDLTGGGVITYRDTYEKRARSQATGTTFVFANDSAGEQALPQLRTDDPGIRARYRELPFPRIPDDQRDPAMRDEWPHDTEKQAQLLTLLVGRAAKNQTEPTDIPSVTQSTKDRLRKDSGRLGAFATRFVRDGAAALQFPDMWEEWCRANGAKIDAPAPGGIQRKGFYRRLSVYVDGLDRPVPLTVKGKKVRGWRGWKLLTVEEAEAAAQALTAAQLAEQVVGDLINAFPELANGGLEAHTVFSDYEKDALNRRYPTGEEFNQDIEKTTVPVGQVEVRGGDRDGEKIDLDTEFSDEQRTAKLRYEAMGILTTAACIMYPTGPVCEGARERINKLPRATYGRENVALVFLRIAEWELDRADAEADATAVVKRAVELKDDELRRDPSKKDYYASDVEDAMKELVGLAEPPAAPGHTEGNDTAV